MLNAVAIARAAALEGQINEEKETSKFCMHMQRLKKILSLPGENTRSLFIFSEENIIRKYARIIIEWGYPFRITTLTQIAYFSFAFLNFALLFFLVHAVRIHGLVDYNRQLHRARARGASAQP